MNLRKTFCEISSTTHSLFINSQERVLNTPLPSDFDLKVEVLKDLAKEVRETYLAHTRERTESELCAMNEIIYREKLGE